MKLNIKKIAAVVLSAACAVFAVGGLNGLSGINHKANADENLSYSGKIVTYQNYEDVYLGGFTLGFDLEGEGALVVGLAEVVCEKDICLPAREAGLKSGDVILSLDGKKITVAADIDEVLDNYNGGGIVAEILSEGKKKLITLYPQKDLSGKYKLGVLIRDYLTGLGTVTFIKKNGDFYSLGHPITDERGEFLKVSGGFCYACLITGVEKGERGRAGELRGTLLRNEKLGTVTQNSAIGLTGKFDSPDVYDGLPELAVGDPEPGAAKIYATISGRQTQSYSISIVKVDKNERSNKNMVVKITDERLIAEASGIVQGMSGSPIVQNGKIVGAITHVFLNDATRGYANNYVNKLAF